MYPHAQSEVQHKQENRDYSNTSAYMFTSLTPLSSSNPSELHQGHNRDQNMYALSPLSSAQPLSFDNRNVQINDFSLNMVQTGHQATVNTALQTQYSGRPVGATTNNTECKCEY